MSDQCTCSIKIKMLFIVYALAFFYENLSAPLLASPPPLPRKGQGEAVSQKQNSDHRKAHSLESINQSWLSEIQSRSPKTERKKGNSKNKKLYLADPGNEKLTREPPQPKRPLEQEQIRLPKRLEEAQEGEPPSFSSAILRFVVFIFLLGFLLYFALRFFRSRNQKLSHGAEEVAQVLLSLPLVQGKFLQIVDVAGQLLVLGVSEAGVQLLTSINDGISADRVRLWQSRQSPELPSNKILDKLAAVMKGTDLNLGNTQSKQNFISMLRQFGGQTGKAKKSDTTDELKRMLLQQKRELHKKDL